MPMCNLAETVHVVWSKQSGKDLQDMYDAMMDDFARAFIQCTRFNVFLNNGNQGGTRTDKVELRFKVANCSRNLNMMFKAIKGVPGVRDFLIADFTYAGEEAFGSAKRRLQAEPGAHDDSYRFDKVNFPQLKQAAKSKRKTQSQEPPSTPTVLNDKNVDDNPTPAPVSIAPVVHVSEVQEDNCDIRKWHICRARGNSNPTCSSRTWSASKQCQQKISGPAPTFYGIRYYRPKLLDIKQFFFFSQDDLNR